MKTLTTNLIVALVATLAFSTVANAQIHTDSAPQRVQTQILPPQGQNANQYFFGMSVELNRDFYGTTLRIVDVRWDSPAQHAGLEIGDEIRTVNGRGFEYASDSFQAVAMMNQFVDIGGGPAPAVAASSDHVQAYVMPPSTPQPIAKMIVKNVRNGHDVQVTVRPTPRNHRGGPAPAVATASSIRN